MGVRSARLDEITKFYELWEEFLKENTPVDGATMDSTQFMDRGGRLFQTYVGGAKLGACHFWVDTDDAPQGFFLAGEPLGFFDMFDDLKNCSIVYGMYIRPEYRGPAGFELAVEAARLDKANGMVHGCTIVKADNKKGISISERTGAKLLDMRYTFVLDDVIKLGESDG